MLKHNFKLMLYVVLLYEGTFRVPVLFSSLSLNNAILDTWHEIGTCVLDNLNNGHFLYCTAYTAESGARGL